MNILVSHCFLGEPCRYDGASRLDRQIIELHRAGHNLIPVCPEVLGGLDIPRSPAEIQSDGRVVTKSGEDVTAAYRAGAERAVEIAKENGCTIAVLKARSPSCGCGEVYDGTFTHTVRPGWGIAARLEYPTAFDAHQPESKPSAVGSIRRRGNACESRRNGACAISTNSQAFRRGTSHSF